MDTIHFIQFLFLLFSALIIAAAVVFRRRIDIFSPMFIFPLAYMLYLGLGSLPVLQDNHTISSLQWVFYLLGLAGFAAGGCLPMLMTGGKSPVSSPRRRPWDRRRLLLASLALMGLAAAARVFIYSRTGIPLFTADPNRIRLAAFDFGALSEISISSEIVFMTAFAGLVLFKKSRFFFLALMVLALVLAIFTGTRTSLIRQLFPCILLYHYMVRKISLRTLGIIVLISLVFIGMVKFIGFNRLWGDAEIEQLRQSNYGPVFYWLPYVLKDFKHGPEGLARVMKVVPSRFGWQYGRLHVLPLLMPLPGSQPQPGVVFKEMVGADFIGVGLAATILAPLYADFGPAGILFGMFLVGFVFQYLYQVARRRHHPFFYLAYGAVFITLILGIRTNYLNFEIIWTLVLLGMINWYAGAWKIEEGSHARL